MLGRPVNKPAKVAETIGTSKIREAAAKLGFDDCRFTAAAPPSTRHHYRKWIKAGCHGTMGYLARNQEKRTDPTRILRQINSIVSLAVSYAQESRDIDATASHSPGIIARYAQFRDYHDVLAEPLEALAKFITDQSKEPTHCLWYVDTGPILERDLAQRAGLGFVGKHTSLISRKLGNWFFIAEILTSAKLTPDKPEKNRCGSCRRCLDVCPTKAITAPFHLDARKCISYHTIEHKGSIPLPYRKAMGTRIFGCDDCLAACPWNRFAREGRLLRSQVRQPSTRVDLEAWAKIEPQTFKQLFADTPFYRTKWRGLMRNVCVALGNIGDRSNLATLSNLATSSEPLVAEHARWAIAQIEERTVQD